MSEHCPLLNIAPAAFLNALDAIEPGVWGIPCSVVMADGRFHEVCLAWENPRYGDKGNWLNPQDIVDVRECQFRMPAKFAHRIEAAGESGMGYHLYVVELSDGTEFVHVAGNLVIDLLNLPLHYTQKDVINVRPHEGRERARRQEYRQIEKYQSIEYARP